MGDAGGFDNLVLGEGFGSAKVSEDEYLFLLPQEFFDELPTMPVTALKLMLSLMRVSAYPAAPEVMEAFRAVRVATFGKRTGGE